jgi:metallo-beta-lactamase family protein
MAKRSTKQAGLTVTFWGAARTVTGSMHLVETAGKRLLLDCGLFQGKRAEARQRNTSFPFKPSQIDAVILSHAHLDHCGNLPNLVRQGFAGPLICTPATRDLIAVMLADSAKIQEEDAAYLNRHHSGSELHIEPLYTRADVFRTLRLCQAVPYDRPYSVFRGIELRFVDAGHVLGSAMVSLHLDGKGDEQRLTFTGDLGRRGLPILRDPAAVPPADFLISESTYGGRNHPPVEEQADALGEVLRRTIDRGGKLLIPAFSLGRTQTVVYFLHRLMNEGRLPQIPIYVDSPLAMRATEVFRLHPECFDEETAKLLEDDPDVFGQKRIHYTQSVEESKRLNSLKEPAVIIASSGMCEAGRILHHLKHNVADPRNTVLIIGYQAQDTLGWRLVKKFPEVKILDHYYPLKAEVVVLNGFSSHADRDDFRAFLGPLAASTRTVQLVHGDMDQATALAQMLRELGFASVNVPDRGESVTLNGDALEMKSGIKQ